MFRQVLVFVSRYALDEWPGVPRVGGLVLGQRDEEGGVAGRRDEEGGVDWEREKKLGPAFWLKLSRANDKVSTSCTRDSILGYGCCRDERGGHEG